MKKIPKLYTKNNKGRYEEYKIPECDTSDTFYQKINGWYEPTCMLLHDSLPEGVWVVTRHRSSTEYISGSYLRERFRLDKVSDIERFPLSKMGHINKVSDRIMSELKLSNTDSKPMTNRDPLMLLLGLCTRLTRRIAYNVRKAISSSPKGYCRAN